jgi:Zinc finger, C2H2 type
MIFDVLVFFFSISISIDKKNQFQFNWISKMFQCSALAGCEFTCDRKGKLEEHERIHTGECPFPCQEDGCDKSFMRRAHLNRHMCSHTGVRAHLCPRDDCGKAFATRQHLNRHLRVHDTPRPFRCDVAGCTRAFVKQSQLKVHSSEHTGRLPHVCAVDGCDAEFQYASGLKRHSVKHTDARPHVCGGEIGCGLAFRRFCDLRTHVRLVHKPQRKGAYVCDECGKQLTSARRRGRHVARAHGGDAVDGGAGDSDDAESDDDDDDGALSAAAKKKPRRVIACLDKACTRTFTRRNNMMAHHRAIHQGIRFDCSVAHCAQTFTTAQACRRHFDRAHRKRGAAAVQAEQDERDAKRQRRIDAKRSDDAMLVQLFGEHAAADTQSEDAVSIDAALELSSATTTMMNDGIDEFSPTQVAIASSSQQHLVK